MNRFLVLIALTWVSLCGCGGSETVGGTGGGTSSTKSCGASNCAGCCYNNVCQTGTTLSACGKAGATCAACGTAQICKADQTCGLDPEGVWRVQPLSAQITPSNNGSSWDGDSSPPDVFIQMTCPGDTGTTSITSAVESYNPTWTSGGCTAKASQLLARGWRFQLWDSDVSVDDPITDPLTGQVTEAYLIAGKITYVPSGGMKSLTVQFQKQP